MAYARPSENDSITSIKDLKSTVKAAIAENPKGELQTAASAAAQDLAANTAAAKELMGTAGVMSTTQASAKAAAEAQSENSKSSEARLQAQITALSPTSGQNRGYGSGVVTTKTFVDEASAANNRRIAGDEQRIRAADRADQAALSLRQSQIENSNMMQRENQQNQSAQAIARAQAQAQKDVAAAQAGASVQAAQYGALGSILGGGDRGSSRHQYW
jgi:hypothetical protein